MKKLLALALLLPLGGCAAADVALMSGAVNVLNPIVNNNPHKSVNPNAPRIAYCTYQISEYTYQSRACPPGVAAGTNFVEMRSQPR